MTQTVNRSEVRFAPREGVTVDASVQAEGSSFSINVEVMDISPSGAKLVLSSPLRSGDNLTFMLSTEDSSVELRQTGNSRWVRLTRGYRWIAGVRFDEPIDIEQLERIVTAGCFEQRAAPRFDVSIQGTARRESTTEDMDVAITNLSATGFRLSSPQQVQPGERVLVGADSENGEVVFPAHVRWSGKQSDEYSLGCEFVNKDIFRHLKHYLPTGDAETEPSPSRSRSWVCALGVALTCAGIAWLCRAELTPLADRSAAIWNSCTAAVQSLITR
jgi:hypothetical protein